MRNWYLYITAVVIAGCAAQPTPIPESNSVAGQLYRSRCGACHAVPHPKRHDYDQWEHMVRVMEKQAQHREIAPPSDEERATILDYLKRHAR